METPTSTFYHGSIIMMGQHWKTYNFNNAIWPEKLGDEEGLASVRIRMHWNFNKAKLTKENGGEGKL